ncbi:hypothetical protein, partial [Xanthovirga aplysinae]|uniref:hypothetical protein n=1 Tax=Xanthovirga aplysinae TaxID=2529853 RepID=UPI0016570D09
FTEGGRMLHNDDLQIMQDELFIALEEQYKGMGAFIFSGCTIGEGTDPETYTISPGLVYINGKILQFTGNSQNTSSQTFNSLYLVEGPATPQEYYLLNSGGRAPKRILYQAELVTTKPQEGEYIKITLDGGRNYADAMQGAFKALSIGHENDDFSGHATLDVGGDVRASGSLDLEGNINVGNSIKSSGSAEIGNSLAVNTILKDGLAVYVRGNSRFAR